MQTFAKQKFLIIMKEYMSTNVGNQNLSEPIIRKKMLTAKNESSCKTVINFGEYGLQALEPGWITSRQIEAARIAMTRHIKRGGKVWINVFPDKPVTEKPAETRMGSGKGNPEKWVAVVRPGRILFELSYSDTQVAREAIERAIQKLPIKARVVQREEGF